MNQNDERIFRMLLERLNRSYAAGQKDAYAILEEFYNDLGSIKNDDSAKPQAIRYQQMMDSYLDNGPSRQKKLDSLLFGTQ